MSKNILITGGSGFIGSHVVDALIKKRHKVTVFDLTPPKRRDVRFIKGSVLDKTAINSALKNINIIFHLAAVSDINKVKKIPLKTIETNILGTTYLLEASRKAHIDRFIFAGSVFSYGTAGNIYTTSKTASESIIKNYKLLYGQKFTILRYSTAFGPRNRTVDAISIFIKRALKNLDLIVHGNGQQKRDYICVKDLAKGSMIALKEKTKRDSGNMPEAEKFSEEIKEELENKVITLSSKKNMKIIDLAKTIIWLTKSKSKIVLDKKKVRIDDFTSNYSNNNKKNEKNVIYWKPKYNFKSRLRQYIKVKRKIY